MLGSGGAGASGDKGCYCIGPSGGGGGGGYYGAGGGGAGAVFYYEGYIGGGGGGGGGGSSYIEPRASKFESWHGWKNATGNGLVVISW